MFGTPLKRKREESPVLVRHKTLYLEDGDIVLTAPYGQRRLVFRVDKIFLARHSPIFKDMLAFSPGGDSADMYEGVPRVDLTDRAQDLAVLLGGMYNMTTLLLQKFDPDKPSKMLGMMRLATKYEVEGVKSIIVKDLEDDWPKALNAYDTWLAERNRMLQAHHKDFWKHIPEPAAAMQFATEFNCHQISAAIMYYLARSSVDGTIANHRGSNRVRWHLLDSKNLFRVLKAQRALRNNLQAFKAFFTTQSPHCRTGVCYRTLEQISDTEIGEECDILNFCSAASTRYDKAVCPYCAAVFRGSTYDKIIDPLKTTLWAGMKVCASSEPTPW